MKGLFNADRFQTRKWYLCLGVNFLLFLFVSTFLKPLLNSGDDAFLMYSFSGAFGTHPTELVDYSWGWHFLFGLVIKELFLNFPSFNWYTFFLLTLHFLSCVLILNFFLKAFKVSFALLMYAFFVTFFEVTFLLSLNFTNTSILCATVGNVLLIEIFFRKSFTLSSLILPFLMLLTSALLRFHSWIFAELIFALFIFFLPRKKSVFYLAFKAALLALIVCLFWIHQQYYNKKIPGWRHQQYISQTLNDFYNSPHRKENIFKDSVEEQFFKYGFFYDSDFVNYARLKTIARQSKTVRSLSSPDDRQKIYWTFVNNRIYILCFVVMFFYLFAKKNSIF